MQQNTTRQGSTNPLEQTMTGLINSPQMPVITGLIVLLVLSRVFFGTNNKSRAYWAKPNVLKRAKRKAKKQRCSGNNNFSADLNKSISLPNLVPGVAVMGQPGSGKTFSVIDPALRSAVDQGYPIILYDFKFPSQTSRIAAYADRNGYEIHCFVPGLGGGVINPFDFLRDEPFVTHQVNDAEAFTLSPWMKGLMATQLAKTLNNASSDQGDSKDSTWENAAVALIDALFRFVNTTPYPDLTMFREMLNLTDLSDRLQHNRSKIDPNLMAKFAQVQQSSPSAKTLASIMFSAQKPFAAFNDAGILSSFSGQSTIPSTLSGKQLLIIGVESEMRDAVAPMIASVLTLLVNRNTAKNRTEPLIVALDEVPTLKLDLLPNWLNEKREAGLCLLLGFQNINQLEKAYGKNDAENIITGCPTMALFNPGSYQTAKMISDMIGMQSTKRYQKSIGFSSGKRSKNRSEQIKDSPLFGPEQMLKLDQGHCILVNPEFKAKREAFIPIKKRIKISKSICDDVADTVSRWPAIEAQILTTRSPVSNQEIRERQEWIETHFPPPPSEEEQAAQRQKAAMKKSISL